MLVLDAELEDALNQRSQVARVDRARLLVLRVVRNPRVLGDRWV